MQSFTQIHDCTCMATNVILYSTGNSTQLYKQLNVTKGVERYKYHTTYRKTDRKLVVTTCKFGLWLFKVPSIEQLTCWVVLWAQGQRRAERACLCSHPQSPVGGSLVRSCPQCHPRGHHECYCHYACQQGIGRLQATK